MAARAANAWRDEDQPKTYESELLDLSAQLLPFQLPAELLWLWRHVPTDAGAWDGIYPWLIDPSFCGHMRKHHRGPAALIEFASVKEGPSLFMELSHERSPGPWVYLQEFMGDYQLVANGVGPLLAAATEILSGQEREIGDYPLPADVDMEHLEAIPEDDATEWPERWRAVEGIQPDSWQVRGATTTVSELLAALAGGLVSATLVGTVKVLAGSGAGSILRITDRTGNISAFCPMSVPRFGGERDGQFEVDVEAGPDQEVETHGYPLEAKRSEVARLAQQGDMTGAAQLGAEIGHWLHSDHAVVITALRPIGPDQ